MTGQPLTLLAVMAEASRALDATPTGGSLHGMYDPASGQPLRGPDHLPNGALEALLVSVIGESFENEQTPDEALTNILKWLGDMRAELGAVMDALETLNPLDTRGDEP